MENTGDQQIVPGISVTSSGQATVDPSLTDVLFDLIDDIHGRCFGVTPHELDLIICCGMGLHKLCVNVFFLFPWLAIRWVLWKEK